MAAARASARVTASAGSWHLANASAGAFEGQQTFGLGFINKTTGVVAGQLAIGSALWVTGDSAKNFKAVDWDPFELTDTAQVPPSHEPAAYHGHPLTLAQPGATLTAQCDPAGPRRVRRSLHGRPLQPQPRGKLDLVRRRRHGHPGL